MTPIDNTLTERGKRYGDFEGHADITQYLKFVMRGHAGWGRLTSDQTESLEMIAHKIGRILNGDPNYADSWHDIAGYARLVEQRLEQAQVPTPKPPSKAPEADKFDAQTAHILRLIKGCFPGAEVTVSYEDEESGLTD